MLKISHSRNNDKEDSILLEEYRGTGDLEILGDLYSRYMHLVYGLCLKYLQNRDDAGDAVMQIFEKLIVEIGRHEINNFKSWLYVLSKNFCLMQIRSEKTKERKMDLWVKDQDESMESPPEMHPIDEEGMEQHSALSECIEKLKDEQKDCVQLFYYQNWSYRQIAEILHLEEKKVKSHLQNAKRNLKICLEARNVKE
ncbi:RNA polymerase sigma factor [Bacteroidota bacterium]